MWRHTRRQVDEKKISYRQVKLEAVHFMYMNIVHENEQCSKGLVWYMGEKKKKYSLYIIDVFKKRQKFLFKSTFKGIKSFSEIIENFNI